MFLDLTDGLLSLITGFLGMLLYPIFSIIFGVIDVIQGLFAGFAGIGEMTFNGTTITSGNSGGEYDSGIVYFVFSQPLVKNMLMSMMLLALFLIVIFTAMAFIKNIYAARPKNWKEIVGNAIKGLANFIILPVCCLLGVWLGNILLQAINGATAAKSTSMSKTLFIASAYNANHYRNLDDDEELTSADALTVLNRAMAADPKNELLPEFQKRLNEANTAEEYAQLVDDIYAQTAIPIATWKQAGYGYSLWQINYLVLIVGGVFMLYVLFSLSFAMVRRLILLTIWFIVSPAMCAMYPLDEGEMVKKWKGQVIPLVLSAYGAVAGLNLFFSILPILDKIELGGNWNFFGMNEIISIFITVTGLLCVKELIGAISTFVGGENAYEKGASQMKATTGAIKKYAGGAAKKTSAFMARRVGDAKTGGFKGLVKGMVGKDAIKGVLNSATKLVTGIDFHNDVKKTYKDTQKERTAKHYTDKYKKEFKKNWSDADLKLPKKGEKETDEAFEKRKEEARKKRHAFIEDAMDHGLTQEEAYAELSKKTKMSIPEIKKDQREYAKQKEEEKMQRQAAYNARGIEFEKSMDNAIKEIKAQELIIKSANSTINSQQSSIKGGLESIANKTGASHVQGKESLVKIMENKIKNNDYTPIDTKGLKSGAKGYAEDFNKQLQKSEEALSKLTSAQSALSEAQTKQKQNIDALNSTFESIKLNFSSVGKIVDDFGNITGKTSNEIKTLIDNIKKDIRK